jgi:ABC-type transport system involved in multi-copper enzyme maturation permease subunit
MTALIRKELRQLLPIGLMWIIIDLLSWGAEIFSTRMDEQTYSEWCSVVCDPGVSWTLAITVLVIAIVIGYSLFPREFDDATINFLRGMPITPAQIFVSKYAAALILSVVMIIFGLVVIELLMLTNPQSLLGTHYRGNTLLLGLRDFIALAVMISYGIFLSRFRTVGLLIMLALLAGLGWLETMQGYSPAWSPIEMFRVEYFGQSIELPWFALLTNAGVGIVLLFLSYRMWTNTEATSVTRDGTISAKGSWLAALGAIGALGVITLIAVALVSPDKRGDGEDKSTITTEHYKFRFHPYLQSKAQTLSENADTNYERLRELIDAKSQPKIRANLNARSEHFAGLATWKSIRIDLSDLKGDGWFEHVLIHESAHVFQSTESDRKLRDFGNSTRFFIEGSAEFLSQTLIGKNEQRPKDWEMAARAVTKHKIRFREMANNSTFASKYDKDLYYTLGDLWTASLASVCTNAVIGKVFRQFGSDDLNPYLSGEELWEVVLQEVGCDLNEVNAHWRKSVKTIASSASDSHYPQFDSVAIQTDKAQGLVIIEAQITNPQPEQWPGSFQLRVARESSLASEPDLNFFGRVQDESGAQQVRFEVPIATIGSPAFRYQIGYFRPGTFSALFEKWRNGRAAD